MEIVVKEGQIDGGNSRADKVIHCHLTEIKMNVGQMAIEVDGNPIQLIHHTKYDGELPPDRSDLFFVNLLFHATDDFVCKDRKIILESPVF
jgi:hypothetical protein